MTTAPTTNPDTAAPADDKNHLLCFGLGYCARTLIDHLSDSEPDRWYFAATRTRPEASRDGAVRVVTYTGDNPAPDAKKLIAAASHILISIPPDLEGDAVVRDFASDIAAAPNLRWIGYLSTIGVYGDTGGAWIDETAPLKPTSERALRRTRAERQWQTLARDTAKRVDIFRLPGIYGPGRSVIDNLRAGSARRVVKAGQVFNRIHVLDIAKTLTAAIHAAPPDHIFNVCDDEPAPPQDVVEYAAELLSVPLPPVIDISSTALSEMAKSFYAENKRVRNTRIKQQLDVSLSFPTYREGLLDILRNT